MLSQALIPLFFFGRLSQTGSEVWEFLVRRSCFEVRTVTLYEKGGTVHTMPLHRRARAYLKAYLEEAGITEGPVFRALDLSMRVLRTPTLGARPLAYQQAYEAVKRRARAAGLDPAKVCNHSFRATGITTYLDNGGKLESAQNMAAHASIKTTKLYDRRQGLVTEDDVELIRVPLPRHDKL
jgi:integrase